MNWRGTGAIPLGTVQAVIKRLQSKPGDMIEEAAEALGRDAAWLGDMIDDGTVHPLRQHWDMERLYRSEPMPRRLRGAATSPRAPAVPEGDWLRVGGAAFEAGVATTTIVKWAECSELTRIRTAIG